MNQAGDEDGVEMGTECVSVIIPCYNQAQFIGSAVESVLSQEPVDVDVIVVDDGSTDNCREVISRFGKSIRAIHQENRGMCGARNRGMADARGDYVLFLDSDDVLLAGALERLLSAAQENPEAGVFYAGARLIDADDAPLCDLIPADMGPDPLAALLLANRIAAPGAVLLRRRVWDDVGEFNPRHGPSADWDYWIRLAGHDETFIRVPEAVIGYRQHRDSHSRKYFSMVDAVRSVSGSHRSLARRSWKHRVARHAGRRVMRYFCVNRALRPAVMQMIRAGQLRQACTTVVKAIFQDWESPLFFVIEYWVLVAAAQLAPTVKVYNAADASAIPPDDFR